MNEYLSPLIPIKLPCPLIALTLILTPLCRLIGLITVTNNNNMIKWLMQISIQNKRMILLRFIMILIVVIPRLGYISISINLRYLSSSIDFNLFQSIFSINLINLINLSINLNPNSN